MPPLIRRTLLIIIALAIPVIPFLVIGELPGQRWLSAYDNNALLFGITGSAVLASDILLPIPSSIIGTLLGARLGLFYGFFATWAGLMLGNLIGYFVGRILFTRLKTDLPETPTVIVLFLSRSVPVLAEALTLAAGGSKIRLFKFTLACFAGNGIYAFVLSANGATLLPDNMMGPGLIIPMLLPVAGWIVWQHLKK